MKILVCGGRDFEDRELLERVLDKYRDQVETIIHGGARGADKMSGEWAETNGINIRVYKADWDRHERAAGPIRNQHMLDDSQPDMVIAFPGGRGTDDMIERSRRKGVFVEKVRYLTIDEQEIMHKALLRSAKKIN